MNTILALITLLSSLVSSCIYTETGKLTYYNPGVMEQVYRNRLLWNHVEPCPECIGMMAVKDCKQLGALAYISLIRGSTTEITGPYLIVDCSNRSHLSGHIKTKLIGEVDYQTAKEFDMDGPLYNVTIYVYK